MADIFAGMQPRPSPLPIEGDSQQPIRNFLSGFQMRQQQQEMALKTKEVASNLVHQDLQNRLMQVRVDDEAESGKIKADYQLQYGNDPTAWINAPLPENPVAAHWVLQQKKSMAETLSGQSVIQDNINWNKSYASIDPTDQSLLDSMIPLQNGRPSPQMRQVMSIAEEKVRNRQQAMAEERALHAPAVTSALIKQETALTKIQGGESLGQTVTFPDGTTANVVKHPNGTLTVMPAAKPTSEATVAKEKILELQKQDAALHKQQLQLEQEVAISKLPQTSQKKLDVVKGQRATLQSQIDSLSSNTPRSASIAAPLDESVLAPNEVIGQYKGRSVVFDRNTKKYLRDAD